MWLGYSWCRHLSANPQSARRGHRAWCALRRGRRGAAAERPSSTCRRAAGRHAMAHGHMLPSPREQSLPVVLIRAADAQLYAPQLEALWADAPCCSPTTRVPTAWPSWPAILAQRRRALRSWDSPWAATSPSRSCARAPERGAAGYLDPVARPDRPGHYRRAPYQHAAGAEWPPGRVSTVSSRAPCTRAGMRRCWT
jgi:hypothetical protein